jgi:hypothetical protein
MIVIVMIVIHGIAVLLCELQQVAFFFDWSPWYVSVFIIKVAIVAEE